MVLLTTYTVSILEIKKACFYSTLKNRGQTVLCTDLIFKPENMAVGIEQCIDV